MRRRNNTRDIYGENMVKPLVPVPVTLNMASAAKEYNDDSTDCAICFEPLSDDETITLKCGHRWHLACIREQLAHAQPSKSSRILFSGCRCAKCNVICDRKFLLDAGSLIQ